MAYSDTAALIAAAGREEDLIELANRTGGSSLDPAAFDVITLAQADADGWIDGYMRRLYGVTPGLPLAVVPTLIRALAAAETIYVLRKQRRVASDDDRTARTEREAVMQAIEEGRLNPISGDTYPIGSDNAPVAVERAPSTGVFSNNGREELKGIW